MYNRQINPIWGVLKKYLYVLGMSLVTTLVSACALVAKAEPPQPNEIPELFHDNEIGGYAELVDTLRAQNAKVEQWEVVDPSFFNVPGQVISVNGIEVQVFEFTDESTRQTSVAQIATDGSSIGTTRVTWVDQPRFWAKGRLVVLYVGQDVSTIQLLSSVLGEPVVQGQPPVYESSLTNTKWELFSFGWPGAHTGVEATYNEGQAILAIWGNNGTVLLSDHAEDSYFQGNLPSNQDYFILLKGWPDGSTSYRMKITIPPLK